MADALEIAKRHDDAFSAQDVDGRRATEASDIEAILPGGMTLRGPDQTLQVSRAFWEAFPDVQLIWENQIESGDMVVIEGSLTGTHTGPFRTPEGEIPASENQVKLRYVSVKRVAGGKVASDHVYFDQMEFLQQIGAMPTTPGS
jgi:predicted ester cyclase